MEGLRESMGSGGVWRRIWALARWRTRRRRSGGGGAAAEGSRRGGLPRNCLAPSSRTVNGFMIVEEMNILTTVFLRYDNEKIVYSHSTLSTKPISNFYRSPEMSDTVDFTIDVSTFVDNINALKKQIQAYIKSKPKHWNPKHSLLVKEIENVDKMKLTLSVLHTINHQNYGEKNIRRSELVLELKKIFENIGIKYHVLPQEIHLTQISTPTLSS
ncbi:hypothetical protein Syun_018025 [Stephania yunnanensis]|uniref:Uncharacterized protein n=1 Tax=Stephania yunnanensis TaxID=152371 RepID=A0AAP0ISY3_9MAGN